MADCCRKPAITDLARSARLSRQATKKAVAAANAALNGKKTSIKPANVKKANVAKAKPCCKK